jgi:cell division protein FtsZ
MNITCSSDLTMEEMTEASDRIYKEVGEDADIIWGTAIDDSLGNDMRVTVIATGIGQPNEEIKLGKEDKSVLRGKVRSLTIEDVKNAKFYDEPTFIRRQQAVGESGGATYRGYKGLVIDNSDLDVPTFLRKKAD